MPHIYYGYLLLLLSSFVACNDPSVYRTKSMLPSVMVQHGQHITHNEAAHPLEYNRTDNMTFVGKNVDGLVHRYAIKVKSSMFHERSSDISSIVDMNTRLRVLAEGHGFRYVKPIPGLENVHVFERSVKDQDLDHFLSESADIEWFDQLFEPRQRVKRQNPPSPQDRVPNTVDLYFDDPLWAHQWNLADRDFRQGGSDPGAIRPGHPIHINVYGSWQRGYRGDGVIIGIVDDGVQGDHPEFSGKYMRDLSWNFNQDNNHPEPSSSDKHGTACAGTASANANNMMCGVGVAYRSRVANLKVLGRDWTSDAEEASALSHACSSQSIFNHMSRFVNDTVNQYSRQTYSKMKRMQTDLYRVRRSEDGAEATVQSNMVSIYSSSWGPVDDGMAFDGPGQLTQSAMRYCTTYGRDNLGSIYIVAGGNGRSNMDMSNYDGYANAKETIAVAACSDYGSYTWYSEEGANIMCAMPSSDNSGRAIISADLMGYQGYSSGHCVQSFGGTSAAAPQLAGMVAIMLQANPSLTWRDVQHIIVRSSRVTRGTGIQWSINSAGRMHSMSLGFGVPDVTQATVLAIQWGRTQGMETKSSYKEESSDWIRPSGTRGEIRPGSDKLFTWNYTSPHTDPSLSLRLEHVHVTIVAETPMGHGYMGATLCSPSQVCSVLMAHSNGRQKSVQWTFQTLRHWDENVFYTQSLVDIRPIYEQPQNPSTFKTWSLHVANLYSYRSKPIDLKAWKIDFYGTARRLT